MLTFIILCCSDFLQTTIKEEVKQVVAAFVGYSEKRKKKVGSPKAKVTSVNMKIH